MILAYKVLWDWVILWVLITILVSGIAYTYGYDRGWDNGSNTYWDEDEEDSDVPTDED